ncbi:spore germination protein [Alkalihalobacillus pseudalcaliphilus]|uniref:spore germination protein n=1 Tax=Alkalihalobacillus pseudalcaliphilus TaxID=79884 RepID=UPI00064D97F0|nr:spore germination protein [Alkalihalobacillus pseudalcaliphilus]KMK76026.1 spore gernimation protein GerA [Alkalihalobacillus pseudalcaliphilus]
MGWFQLKRKIKKNIFENVALRTVSQTLELHARSDDFCQHKFETKTDVLLLSYYQPLINHIKLERLLIEPIKEQPFTTLENLVNIIHVENIKIIENPHELNELLLIGAVAIRTANATSDKCLVAVIPQEEIRNITIPEVEFSVIGPKEAFVESIDVNINLVRKRLPTPNLISKEFIVGSLSKTKVIVMYLESVANEDNVKTMLQRISSIEIETISDSSYINQLIEDFSNSPFPQFIDTERPDRVAAVLAEGKIAVFVNGSPQVITAPTTFIEFFSSFEDYFLGWQIASAFRLIRIFAVWFSIFATPLYVAILTYHTEIIPQDLMATLILSRDQIPFPPIIEAIFLEITIELLREAGARLPTKVGQTIGIVGGIVIGTAAVEAGLTSNVLLIFVALAALASFTTPIYSITNTIRIIRFPFLFAAQLWGIVSLTILFMFLLVHLLSIKSLNRPYLAPIYPFKFSDLKDSFIRLPFHFQSTRPDELQTKRTKKFSKEKAKKKLDIDEGI